MTIHSILVPTDLRDHSASALALAKAIAKKENARLHVVHAYAPVVVPGPMGLGHIPYDDLRRSALQRLKTLISSQDCDERTCTNVVAMGDPLSVILDAVSHLRPDLIVMCSERRAKLRAVLQPSVAESVLQNADVPVLILKTPGARRSS